MWLSGDWSSDVCSSDLDCQYGTHNGKYALRIGQKLTTAEKTWQGDLHVN